MEINTLVSAGMKILEPKILRPKVLIAINEYHETTEACRVKSTFSKILELAIKGQISDFHCKICWCVDSDPGKLSYDCIGPFVGKAFHLKTSKRVTHLLKYY